MISEDNRSLIEHYQKFMNSLKLFDRETNYVYTREFQYLMYEYAYSHCKRQNLPLTYRIKVCNQDLKPLLKRFLCKVFYCQPVVYNLYHKLKRKFLK